MARMLPLLANIKVWLYIYTYTYIRNQNEEVSGRKIFLFFFVVFIDSHSWSCYVRYRMEQQKDVSEYLHEVNFLELNSKSLWCQIQESLTKESVFVVDMGTDQVHKDNVVTNSESQEVDIEFYLQVGIPINPDIFEIS